MSRAKLIFILVMIICSFSLCYNIIAAVNVHIYKAGVYDCSNMCTDQATFFEYFGLDVDVAINYTENHSWLLINTPLGIIHWESTQMAILLEPYEVEKVYDNIWLHENSNDFKSGREVLESAFFCTYS